MNEYVQLECQGFDHILSIVTRFQEVPVVTEKASSGRAHEISRMHHKNLDIHLLNKICGGACTSTWMF